MLYGLCRTLDCLLHRWLFQPVEFTQDMVAQGIRTRTANPNPQTHKGLAQIDNHRFQPVVAAVASSWPQPEPAKRQSHIIDPDQDLFRLNLKVPRELANDISRSVHIGQWLDQEEVPPFSQI